MIFKTYNPFPSAKNLIDGKEIGNTKMKCRICGAKLEQRWLYCPYCGSRRPSFQDLSDTQGSPGRGFTMEISKKDIPRVSIKSVKTPRSPTILEPRVVMKEDGRAVEVHLPHVKAQGDITIRKFSTSIEVKARAGAKIYFTVIPLKYRNLIKQEFNNGLLTLRFM